VGAVAPEDADDGRKRGGDQRGGEEPEGPDLRGNESGNGKGDEGDSPVAGCPRQVKSTPKPETRCRVALGALDGSCARVVEDRHRAIGVLHLDLDEILCVAGNIGVTLNTSRYAHATEPLPDATPSRPPRSPIRPKHDWTSESSNGKTAYVNRTMV
jgi:hypothetical protein